MNAPPSIVPRGAHFEFGESPFRVKGVLYRGTQNYFAKQVPGGLDALLEVIEEPELRAFIAQRFLASTRYDVMPVPALIAYEAIATGKTLEEYLDVRTEWQAQQDIHGVYRLLLQLTNPTRVMSRLPRVLVQMFDFPTMEVEELGECERLATFHRIPAPLEEWLKVGFRVYSRTVLRAAGAKNVVVTFRSSATEKPEAGIGMRSLRMHIVW